MHSKEEPRVWRMLYVNKLDFSVKKSWTQNLGY